MQLKLHTTSFGVGDAIMVAYSAYGYALAGHEVIFHTRHPNWLSGVKHPKLTIAFYDESIDMGGPPRGVNVTAMDYSERKRSFLPWKVLYSQAIAAHYGIEYTEPVAPIGVPHYPASIDKQSYAVLVPFADYKVRCWPVQHYARLAELLSPHMDVIALGMDKEKLQAAFEKTSGISWYAGYPPEWVLGVLSNARIVIGNDSGLQHVAGMLNKPTIAVHAGHSPVQIFSHSHVQSILPTCNCVACNFFSDRGWRQSCDDDGCYALGHVSPEMVFNHAKAMLLL